MVRPITEEDLGLRVLYDGTGDTPGPEAEGLVDIVAVHGMGAHPDDTWCQKIDSGGGGGPVFVNWLEDPSFLPSVVPRARIMRYGYNSRWFGEDAIKTKMSDISQTFLFELKDCRKTDQSRPLILIGHSFGGLVLLKTLVDSHTERNRWPGIYDSTVGLVFLGTPFRGTHDSLSQGEILKRAQELFTGSPVHGENLEILRAGGESLTDLVDTYLRIARQSAMPRVACFYEQKASDVGRILGKDPDKAIPSGILGWILGKSPDKAIPSIILVDESSGSLDLREKSDKYALPRTHFNIQKFGSPRDQGFRLVGSAILKMVEEGPELVSTRAKCVRPPLRAVPGVRPRLWVVPFERNRSFVGRDTILQELLKKADPYADTKYCQRTVLEGLGGIGKTQIALEAAYRIRDKHPDCSVFWVPAVDATSFENAYREIGRELKINGIDDDKADVKALVRAALSHQDSGTWLLIVDNADDAKLLLDRTTPSPLDQYLPSIESGSILFTTRTHQLAVDLVDSSRDGILSVDEMSDAEARQLLTTGLKDKQKSDDASIASLLDFLANLPLAIKQATAYIAKTGISITRYLDHCRSSNDKTIKLLSRDFEDRGRYKQIKNPVATTWLISFEHVSRDNPLAAQYLKFICFLAEKDIPISLLPLVDDEIEADDAMGALEAYAFVTQREEPGSFDIHRLVRLAMRNWVDGKGEQGECVTKVVQRVAEAFPFPEHENREVWMRYLPHAQSVLRFSGVVVDGEEAKRDLLSRVGLSFHIQGRYDDAEAMHRQALELREKVLGREHPSTLASMNNLASVLDSQGRYDDAEAMHRRALELREKVLGREHPSTLASMNNLALVLGSQGRYDDAEAMHRRALELREKVLGREHPSTLASMNNLASVLDSQGRYDDAEAMHRQALELREKVLGREHPSTLASMNNLALVLDSLGRYDDAEAMHRQALELREKVLGREHPSTLASMNNLARVLGSLGRYDDAEAMHRQALELREKVLGREHPSTLASMSNLANVLDSLGRYDDAEAMHRQALELREKVLGREHPSTLASMNNLALVLGSLGRYDDAEAMHRQEWKLSEKVLGREHPSTLASMNNLARVLGSLGRYDDAEAMHRQALELSEKVLGREHPSTLTSMNNLANVLGSLGRYDDAEAMHRQALELREKVLGREHPSTLASMSNLARVLGSLGRYDDAEAMHRQALELREKVLGREHPSTLASMSNLANVLDSLGRYDDAEAIRTERIGRQETQETQQTQRR